MTAVDNSRGCGVAEYHELDAALTHGAQPIPRREHERTRIVVNVAVPARVHLHGLYLQALDMLGVEVVFLRVLELGDEVALEITGRCHNPARVSEVRAALEGLEGTRCLDIRVSPG